MHRVIVADDERHVVDWVVDLLNTHLPDLEVQPAYNGLEVLHCAESTAFDLAILDIMMPQYNGIETAKQLLGKFPNCKILLLTGYDEFDLIYQVNHLKNIRYSLKTETDREILGKVQQMLAESEQEQRQRQILDEATRKGLLLRHFEQRGMLYDLIFESTSSRSMQAKFRLYEGQLSLEPQQPLYAALIHFPQHDTTRHILTNDLILRLYRTMENTVQQFFRFALLDVNRDSAFLLAQPLENLSGAACPGILKTELDRGLVSLDWQKGQTIRFFVWGSSCSWQEGNRVYNALVQRSRYCGAENMEFHVFGMVLEPRLSGDGQESESTYGQFSQAVQKLASALVQGDQAGFGQGMTVLRQLQPQLYRMNQARQAELRGQLALVFIQRINLHHIQEELSQKLSFAPLYKAMATQDWEELFTYIQRLSGEIFSLSREKSQNESVLTAERIREYIQEHLSENLSVSHLSEVFNYNPSYISRLFKQVQGETLSQYLKRIRLNRAKELLRSTNLPIQAVADATGFDTVQYFSMVFRKEIGITPTAYRTGSQG